MFILMSPVEFIPTAIAKAGVAIVRTQKLRNDIENDEQRISVPGRRKGNDRFVKPVTQLLRLLRNVCLPLVLSYQVRSTLPICICLMYNYLFPN